MRDRVIRKLHEELEEKDTISLVILSPLLSPLTSPLTLASRLSPLASLASHLA
jgi:hypothetical protein